MYQALKSYRNFVYVKHFLRSVIDKTYLYNLIKTKTLSNNYYTPQALEIAMTINRSL